MTTLMAIPFAIPFMVISTLFYFYRKWFVTPEKVKGKVVLVTGASSGLGEAIAKLFAKHGAKVVLCARNMEELKRVKKEISGKENSEWPLVYTMDVTKPDDIANCVNEIEEKHGGIHILVSNAGISLRGTVMDTTVDVHRKMMEINYFGPVGLVKAVLPGMISRKSGHIVSIGSVQSQLSIPYRCSYAASKHASQAFFDCLRAEVACDNILVSVVNPGYINTNLSRNALSCDGKKHGVLDTTTAAGMTPQFVAEQVYESVRFRRSELYLADMQAFIASMIRWMCPALYFYIMEKRAAKEANHYKKKM